MRRVIAIAFGGVLASAPVAAGAQLADHATTGDARVEALAARERLAGGSVRRDRGWSDALRAASTATGGGTPARQRRAGRAAIGAVAGGVVGAALGYGVGRAACDACDEPTPVYAAAAVGAGVGAAVGVTIALRRGRLAITRAGWHAPPDPVPARLSPNESLQRTWRPVQP